MKVSELMHEGLISAEIKNSLRQVAKIMKDNDIGSLPILEAGKAAGFVTDRDIVLACAEDDVTLDDTIDVAMSPECIAVSMVDDITEAARIMEEHQISRVLVVSGERPVGIITLQDTGTNLENHNLTAEVLEQIKQ